MKAIKKYLVISLLFLMLFPACNNDLDELVYSDVTEQSYTYTDAYKAIGIVYANMRSLFSHTNYHMAQEATADGIVMPANASGWDDGGIYRRMHLHTWNSENPQMSNMWNSFYQGVLNSNRVIEQLENGTVPPAPGISKESLVSEMKVARAFFYWLILDNFGDAPLITLPTIELPEKVSRSELYKFVVSEITEALTNLSEDKNQLMYGRFNKWAAKALLANVYLNAQVYIGEPKWEDCITQCNDIIKAGKYSLDADFKSIFKTQNEGSPEIIFAVPFDENVATGLNIHMYSWHGSLKDKVNMQATPWGSGSAMGITQFIDTYDPADIRLTASWLHGPQFSADGTALKGTYDLAGKPLVFTKELPDGLYTGEAEGYRMNKFEVKLGAKGDLSNDFPFFRYAQVLLMNAESLVRLGRNDEAALLVTEVRRRAFKNDPEKVAVTGADLIQNSTYKYGYVENYKIVDKGDASSVQFGRMYDELGWEFAWEGFRRRDMIRFGTYTSKSWLSHKPAEDYRTTFPIPQQTINSNPNLIQTNGY